MAAPDPSMSFGMNDIKVTSLDGSTQADLPAAMKLSFKEVLKTGESPGDDSIQALAAFLEKVEWELEAGGISLDAYAIMSGATVTTTGVTPNEAVAMPRSAGARFPYFKVYGRSLGDGDDDVHIQIFKAKVMDGLEGSLENGEFVTTGVKGSGIDDGTNGIWEPVINETATALPSS